MLILNHVTGFIMVRPADQSREAFEEEIEAACRSLGSISPGVSVSYGKGYWAPTNQFEDNATITVNYSCEGDPAYAAKLINTVRTVALAWGRAYAQDAVAIVLDGGGLEIVDLKLALA